MTGHPVADGTHAAGVGGDVPPERAALLARRHRVDEPERRELAVELLERHPRLDDGDLVLGVDLARSASCGRRRAGCRRPPERRRRRAPCRCRGPRPGRRARWPAAGSRTPRRWSRAARRPAERPAPCQRLVVGVVGVDRVAGHDVVLADCLAQLLQEFRHATATPTSDRSGGPTLPGRTGPVGPVPPPLGQPAPQLGHTVRDLRRRGRCRLLLELGDGPLNRRQPRAGSPRRLGPRAASSLESSNQLHHSSSSDRVSAT